ncbi:MAG: cytochrome c [Myxococcales bacterium]|nr:cytochrome c [Myxococcales bacterium]
MSRWTALIARCAPVLGLLTVAALAGGCRVEREPNYEWLPWINHMFFPTAAESQLASKVFKNGMVLQVPPVGTIARGHVPLHYTADAAGATQAGLELHNPITTPTPEDDERGKVMFTTFCAPCHGPNGAGDGPVSKRGMPGFPINNASAGAGLLPDGHIFHIVTYGRNMMPSYASQTSPEDRWRIIAHVRRLQAAYHNVPAPTP